MKHKKGVCWADWIGMESLTGWCIWSGRTDRAHIYSYFYSIIFVGMDGGMDG